MLVVIVIVIRVVRVCVLLIARHAQTPYCSHRSSQCFDALVPVERVATQMSRTVGKQRAIYDISSVAFLYCFILGTVCFGAWLNCVMDQHATKQELCIEYILLKFSSIFLATI